MYGSQTINASYVLYRMIGKRTNVATVSNLVNQDPIELLSINGLVLDLQIKTYNVVGGVLGLISNKSASTGSVNIKNLILKG